MKVPLLPHSLPDASIRLRLQPDSASWASSVMQHPCLPGFPKEPAALCDKRFSDNGRRKTSARLSTAALPGSRFPNTSRMSPHSQQSGSCSPFLPLPALYYPIDSDPQPVTLNLSLLFVLGLTQQTYSSLCLGRRSQSVSVTRSPCSLWWRGSL